MSASSLDNRFVYLDGARGFQRVQANRAYRPGWNWKGKLLRNRSGNDLLDYALRFVKTAADVEIDPNVCRNAGPSLNGQLGCGPSLHYGDIVYRHQDDKGDS